MSNQPKPFDPLWLTAYNWLTHIGTKLNRKYCEQEIATHPDFPALTSLTDFLDAGGLAYNAVQADSSFIHEFNYPLLAHIKQPGMEHLHIIKEVADWNAKKTIVQHWSGIVV